AGIYAYPGRDYVMEQTLDILRAKSFMEVHNHHNYACPETHSGKECIAVRTGRTPAAPGHIGFVAGSMADVSAISRGANSASSRNAFYSTIHGAGRVMSRTKAAGKMNWRTRKRRGGAISEQDMQQAVDRFGVELRGAGTDESPFVYRKLQQVLDAHERTIEVLHTLKPIGVVMSGD